MLSASEVARYFLAIQDEGAGELISNLKVQKLVYYAQGFHLALHGEPLFAEQIKAWNHGPVVPQLWHEYKAHGSGPLPVPGAPPTLPKGVRSELDEVYRVYGQFTAWRLRDLTHTEPPWKEAFETPSQVVTRDSMREYFKTRLRRRASA